MAGPDPSSMTVNLYARVVRPGEFEPILHVAINTECAGSHESETLAITFDRPDIPLCSASALLGGLLTVLQSTQKNIPLLVCSSCDYLLRALVKERQKFENNILDANFHQAVFAQLNERTGRTQFKKVSINPAKLLFNQTTPTVEWARGSPSR
jgi:hypothetical protein